MFLDIFLVILGLCFLIVGLIGCILPVIPGPPLSYVALVLLQITRFADFSGKFLLIAALITVIVTVVDYLLPIWGTKKIGGSRAGTIGAVLGLIVGLFFVPVGIFLGPFVGAFLGETIVGRDTKTALRSGLGSLMGFLMGAVMKLTVCIVFSYYFIKEMIVMIFV